MHFGIILININFISLYIFTNNSNFKHCIVQKFSLNTYYICFEYRLSILRYSATLLLFIYFIYSFIITYKSIIAKLEGRKYYR